MNTISFIVIGAFMLGGSAIGGGLIIRHLGRKQAGMAFYACMLVLSAVLFYGVFPLFQLAGTPKTLAYAVGLCTALLFSQAVFGNKIDQTPPQ